MASLQSRKIKTCLASRWAGSVRISYARDTSSRTIEAVLSQPEHVTEQHFRSKLRKFNKQRVNSPQNVGDRRWVCPHSCLVSLFSGSRRIGQLRIIPHFQSLLIFPNVLFKHFIFSYIYILFMMLFCQSGCVNSASFRYARRMLASESGWATRLSKHHVAMQHIPSEECVTSTKMIWLYVAVCVTFCIRCMIIYISRVCCGALFETCNHYLGAGYQGHVFQTHS